MKNELSERKESGVLFEPPEPLFGELPLRRRIVPRVLVFCILLGIVIGLWAVAVSGENEETQGNGEPPNTESYAESEWESATHTYSGEATEAESESAAERETEMETQTEKEGSSEKVTETESSAEICELDMSEAEKGDGYAVSYTDKLYDAAGLLDRGFPEKEQAGASAPVILVLHTHTSEEYTKSAAPLNGVAAVGDALCSKLNLLGLGTVHCAVIHDGKSTNAYSEARETIKTMLKIYPSITYVIDLHRMELAIDGQTVKTVSGCTDGAAQIRLTVSADAGLDWQESLSLALELRQSLNRGGARICMPTVISQSRYNSDLARYYIMADIGASGNTVSEAKAAAVRLAQALADVLLKK